MQIEVRRQQQRQNQLRKELERTRREKSVQDANALRYAELQEEIAVSDVSLAAAEREELHAVSRLQNSQGVRSEVVNQLEDIAARRLIDVMANHLPLASSDMAAEAVRGLRSATRDQGEQSHPSHLAGNSHRSRRNGHMADQKSLQIYVEGEACGCMGLGQITEERQEDEGIDIIGGAV